MSILSIIILNYNTKDLTIACLKSLTENYKEELKKEEYEIIVVDNASTDGSVSEITKLLNKSNQKLIENQKNLGFTKGNNLAAKNAKGKYLFFLNSDTEVLDRGLVEMVDFMEKNQNVGILGAKLLNTNGSSQKSAGRFLTVFNVLLMLLGGDLGFLRFSSKKIKNVDWVSGASMMISSGLFKKINGFDENIFMYTEDMEICYRIRKDGFETFFYPRIKIVHKEIGSSNRSFAIVNIYKSLLYFYKKHRSVFELYIVKSMLVLKAQILILIGTLSRNSYLTSTYKKAIKF
ncbi:glycosyltransferase family 2 protein [Candidatus Microgenomates bacterium]|nr:MAG: glycosyltransferase family 2 protein [Candidatus Microgenomates bacterium]